MIHMPAISVVIPTFKEKGVPLTLECVRSIIDTHSHFGKQAVEIVVVEDSDDDSIVEAHHRNLDPLEGNVTIISQPNGGFSKACNKGIRLCNGGVVFLCNNDVEFFDPSLQMLCDFALNMNAGVVGCRLLYPNYTVQHGGVTYVPLSEEAREKAGIPGYFDHVGRGAHQLHPSAYTIKNGLVTGGLFGISRWAIDVVGLLDERFSFTAEDVDYCLSVMNSGRDCLYMGYAAAFHKEGATRGVTPEEKLAIAPDVAEKEAASLRFLFKKWEGIEWRSLIRG